MQSALPAARRGDRDAAFYIYEALHECDTNYRAFFERAGKERTIDEALQWYSTHPSAVRTQIVQDTYDKCHDLREDGAAQWGTPQKWLAQATVAGQPVAQATTAVQTFLQQTLHGYAANTPGAQDTVPESSNDPRALLRAAAQSNDPAVLWKIGEAQGFLEADKAVREQTEDELAWWLQAPQLIDELINPGGLIESLASHHPSQCFFRP